VIAKVPERVRVRSRSVRVHEPAQERRHAAASIDRGSAGARGTNFKRASVRRVAQRTAELVNSYNKAVIADKL
jgi:hypothetical protein